MLDTTLEIEKKQREIILSKTPSERFMLGLEMIDFGRMVVESNIRQTNPTITELDLKVEVFKRYYGNIFDADDLEKIIVSIKKHYLKGQAK